MKGIEGRCEFHGNEAVKSAYTAIAQVELSKQYAEASQKASEDSQGMFTKTQEEGYRLLVEC